MASVNDWRFELERQRAEEEREARARFGWQDLVGLLESAANIHMGYKGMQETGRRTDLMQDTHNLDVQGTGMDALSEGRVGTWSELDEAYQGAPTVSQIGEVSGPLGRQQFTELPPQEWPEVPGSVHVGEGRYRTDEDYLNPYQLWQMEQAEKPVEMTPYQRWQTEQVDTPAPLTDLQRMGKIEGGWIPEENITSYDLATQQPMVGGQPRPAVAGLVAPAMPEPGAAPPTDLGKMFQFLNMTKDPVDPYSIAEMPGLMQSAGVLVQSGGQVPWDSDDLAVLVEDQLLTQSTMTPAEIVAGADKMYGEGWGLVLWRIIEAQVAQGR